MPRGRGRGPQMSNEKAKDFKGTMKKLMAYLSAYILCNRICYRKYDIQYCRTEDSWKGND